MNDVRLLVIEYNYNTITVGCLQSKQMQTTFLPPQPDKKQDVSDHLQESFPCFKPPQMSSFWT